MHKQIVIGGLGLQTVAGGGRLAAAPVIWSILVVLLLSSFNLVPNEPESGSYVPLSSVPQVFLPDAKGAELALDDSDNFFIIYLKNGDLYARKYGPDYKLKIADKLLYSNGTNEGVDGKLDGSGFLHLTWTTDHYGARSIVYMKLDGNLDIVAGPVKLSVDDQLWDLTSSIAVNSLGQAVVMWNHWWGHPVWYQEDVVYALVNSDGSVNFTHHYLAPPDWDTEVYPKKAIMIDDSDNVHFIYLNQVSVNYLYYKKLGSDVQTILVDNKKLITTPFYYWASTVDMTLGSGGLINIAYSQGIRNPPDGGVETWFVQSDLSGNLVSSSILLSTDDDLHSKLSYLVTDSNGYSYVIWSDQKDGDYDVLYAVIDAGGALVQGQYEVLETPTNASTYYMGAVFNETGFCYWSYIDEDGTHIIYPVAPTAEAGGPYSAVEAETVIFNGSGSQEGNGGPLRYRWDLDGDGFWDTGWSDYATASLSLGDDSTYSAMLQVTDGLTYDSDTALVDYQNTPPRVLELNWSVSGAQSRTIGYWKHQCGVSDPVGDHVGIQEDFVTGIATNSDVFRDVESKAELCEYLWVLNHSNMTQKATQQLVALWLNVVSGKLEPDSRFFAPQLNNTISVEEAIDWIEEAIVQSRLEEMEAAKDLAEGLNTGQLCSGNQVIVEAIAFDPGSDDLTFAWEWGDGNTTENVYYNDGVGPDPYPSPEVNPITVTDTVQHGYASAGTYTITLTVTDDDGGITSYSLNLTL